MERIKRGWWLYNGILVIALVTVSGVLVGVNVILKKAWGLELGGWTTLPSMIAITLIKHKAEKLALAACRAAKLPPEGVISRWLEKRAPDELPVPEPPPIDWPQPKPRNWPVWAWLSRILGALFAALSVASVFDRDWENFGLGIVGAVMFLGLLALAEREVYVLQANTIGLHYGKTGCLVAWDSVERGWVSQRHGFNGKATSEWLCLENARGRRIFDAPLQNLPPDVRADLFAWLRARTGLRDGGVDA